MTIIKNLPSTNLLYPLIHRHRFQLDHSTLKFLSTTSEYKYSLDKSFINTLLPRISVSKLPQFTKFKKFNQNSPINVNDVNRSISFLHYVIKFPNKLTEERIVDHCTDLFPKLLNDTTILNKLTVNQLHQVFFLLTRCYSSYSTLDQSIDLNLLMDYLIENRLDTIKTNHVLQHQLIQLIGFKHHQKHLSKFVHLITLEEITINPEILPFLVNTIVNHDGLTMLKQLHGAIAKPPNTMNEELYHQLIISYSKMGEIKLAHAMFERLRLENKPIPIYIYTTLIHGYGDIKDDQSVLNIFKEVIQQVLPNDKPKFISLVISVLSESSSIKQVLILSHSRDHDSITDIDVLNNEIKLKLVDNDFKGALKLKNQFIQSNFKPSQSTYVYFLEYCIQQNDLDLGLKIFQEAKERLSPDEEMKAIYNLAIKLCCDAGEPSVAEDIIAEGVKSPKRIEATSFGPVMYHYLKRNEPDKVIKIYTKSRVEYQFPWNRVVNLIYIKALFNSGQVQSAILEIKTYIINSDYQINQKAMATFCMGIAANLELDEMIPVIEQLRRFTEKEIVTFGYNSALFVLLSQGRWQESIELIGHNLFDANDNTLNLISIHGCLAQKYQLVIDYFKDWTQTKNIQPRQDTVEYAIKSYYHLYLHDEARQLFRQYFNAKTQLKPTKHLSKILFNLNLLN